MQEQDLLSIAQLENFHFIVEDYQRGYKWGIQQIDELLTDILEFSKDAESFYCLQPVVVKEIKEKTFELIDGQQRLTTIFIILKCLEQDCYTISYNTRISSEEFLNKIDDLDIISDLNIDSDDAELQLNNGWNLFIEDNREKDNVDNFHFYCAFQYIKKWFVNYREQQTSFKNNLFLNTKVIWHEPNVSLDENELSAKEIFINFNHGKIDLAQAELIKALFVLQLGEENNIELRIFKTNQFSEEWNAIENKLQDDEFWYFVSNDISDDKKSNRIDLLFDLVAKKPKTSNDKLFSYHLYLEKYRRKVDLGWEEIRDIYNQLHEWFDDRSLYHLIGYIVYENLSSVSTIKILFENSKNKKTFSNDLKELIKIEFFTGKHKSNYDLDSISYDTKPKQIQTLLLLHNVINYQNTDSNYRFPFDRLKTERGWSLEHIHAQNTDDLEKIKDLKSWIKDIELLKNDFNANGETFPDEKLNNLKLEIDYLDEEKKIPNDIKKIVSSLDEDLANYFQKHSISNLCLLDRKTNSSLGKKYFPEKRAEIMEIDKMTLAQYNTAFNKTEKQKPYIPLATKQVFLKYYNTQNTNDIQFAFWGFKDREDYKKNIEDSIKMYLKTEMF